ncbi:unnamed protein product [Chrysoparadoxa australica]
MQSLLSYTPSTAESSCRFWLSPATSSEGRNPAQMLRSKNLQNARAPPGRPTRRLMSMVPMRTLFMSTLRKLVALVSLEIPSNGTSASSCAGGTARW